MPALTRGAARRLGAANESDGAVLALREAVTSKAGVVWEHRGDVDAYCGATRAATEKPQVDHCLEVQLAEVALVRTYSSDRGSSAQSMATAQATELIRNALNGVANLNVTSAKINQAKRGPFTAALNRLQSDKFRSVTIEQLCRQGRGKWMVDDGTWARIEATVVSAHDDVTTALQNVTVLPAAGTLINGSLDELSSMLDTLGFH
jgi:hypothetical protein